MQEIIWRVQPDLIIETGIAHGGSLIFYASLLEMIGKGKILGVDIDIRPHNRTAIQNHSMYKRIDMINGSSIAPDVFKKVEFVARDANSILVVLDSNHTHEHVLKELELYAALVTKGSYLVVFDTVVEYMPKDAFPDRPWGKGNNPFTALTEFLQKTGRFEIDEEMKNKLLLTVAPSGYLKCIRD